MLKCRFYCYFYGIFMRALMCGACMRQTRAYVVCVRYACVAEPNPTVHSTTWFMKSQNELWLSSCIQQSAPLWQRDAFGGWRLLRYARFRAWSRRQLSHKNDKKERKANLLEPRSELPTAFVCAPSRRPLSQWVDETELHIMNENEVMARRTQTLIRARRTQADSVAQHVPVCQSDAAITNESKSN